MEQKRKDFWKKKKKYSSNWELAAARSAEVIGVLTRDGGVDPTNVVLAAYGEFRPVGDNGTKEGREQLRAALKLLPGDVASMKALGDEKNLSAYEGCQ